MPRVCLDPLTYLLPPAAVKFHKILTFNILWDYLAYTVKVLEMFSIYKWDSVLRYDHAYRKTRATVGFRVSK